MGSVSLGKREQWILSSEDGGKGKGSKEVQR